ncbi:hypothetical protein [Halorubrum sp. F4]|uniref:hypothetical protein n=1 Tax=Halorubrum sp. F4 TaxID=2989715 RepID=UPI00247FEA00|nr:hypothetical protein [Halorubrum sp. F4]
MYRRKALGILASIGGTGLAGCLNEEGEDPTDPKEGEVGIEIVGPTSITADSGGAGSQQSTEHNITINIYLGGMPDSDSLDISAQWLLEQSDGELGVVDTWSETLSEDTGFSTDIDFVQATFTTDVSLVRTTDSLQMRFNVEVVADGETFENSRNGSLVLPD